MKTKTYYSIIAKDKDFSLCNKWFFQKSSTGELILIDNTNLIEEINKTVCDFSIDISPFFSTSWYTYFDNKLFSKIFIEVHGSKNFENTSFFPYLIRISSLLVAINAKDSLLVYELLQRHQKTLMKFPKLTMQILKPFSVETLFTSIYGGFNYFSETDLQKVLNGNFNKTPHEWNIVECLFHASKDRLFAKTSIKGTKNPKELMIEFFKNNTDVVLTMSLVGTNFESWVPQNLNYLSIKLQKAQKKDFLHGTHFTTKAREHIFSKTNSIVKAEPQNPFDTNAIAVFFHDIQAKAKGQYVFQKAGYLRRTGAEIIRRSRPNKLIFDSKLFRIGNAFSNQLSTVVISITI
ncbi:MAG: hypothetical protein GX220_04460 [Treponema sp.]|nr:hypothetical protein [Treponema sp.]